VSSFSILRQTSLKEVLPFLHQIFGAVALPEQITPEKLISRKKKIRKLYTQQKSFDKNWCDLSAE